jgi:hypothetical protein
MPEWPEKRIILKYKTPAGTLFYTSFFHKLSRGLATNIEE